MWRVELHIDGHFNGVVYEHKQYCIAMRFAKRLVKGHPNYIAVVIKVGGVPLQCCIDRTQAHYVYGCA